MDKRLNPHADNGTVKNEMLIFFAGILSLLACALGMYLVTFLPADTDLSQYEGVLLPGILEWCAPEPYEFMQYELMTVLFPSLFLVFYCLLSKRVKDENGKLLYGYNELHFLAPIAVSVVMFAAYFLMYQVYAEEMAGFSPLRLLLAFLAAFAVALIIKYSEKVPQKKQKTVFFVLMAASFVLYFARMYPVDFLHLQIEEEQHHFYAFWYPVYKVLSARTPGVDFDNIYGLYPYLVAPVLKLFGFPNYHAVSAYVALCMMTVAAGYCAVLYTFTHNKILAALAAFSASFFGPLCTVAGGFYLQLHPTRTLFISIVFICVAIVYGAKSKAVKCTVEIITPLILALSVFWNIESGIVCIVVWAGFHVYQCALNHRLVSKETLFCVLKYSAVSILSLGLFFALSELVTYLRAGVFVGKDAITFGLNVFAGTGFFMWKMQFGVWIGIALMFLVALALSLPYVTTWKKTDVSRRTITGLFVVSITAIGAFSYFMGRSYPPNVLSFYVYCVILAPFLLELYTEKQRLRRTQDAKSSAATHRVIKIKKALLVYVIAVALVLSVLNIAGGFSKEHQYRYYGSNQSQTMFDDTAAMIQQWAQEENDGEIPNMLVYFSAFYDQLLQRPAKESVCEQIDWFYLDNAHSYIDYIRSHGDESFVMDEGARETMLSCFPDEWAEIEQEFELNAAKTFVFRHYENSTLYFYQPKK